MSGDMEHLGDDTVRSRTRAIILEVAPRRDGPTGGDARLVEDLDFHSLALLELAFTLEDEFDLAPIPEEIAQKIRTVQDVEDHVIDNLRRRAEGVAPGVAPTA